MTRWRRDHYVVVQRTRGTYVALGVVGTFLSRERAEKCASRLRDKHHGADVMYLQDPRYVRGMS